MCSSSSLRIASKMFALVTSPMPRMYSMPRRSRSTASISTARSASNIWPTVWPMRSGNRRWKFGSPSRKRIRSARVSACRISSIDSARVCLASFTQPKFSCIL